MLALKGYDNIKPVYRKSHAEVFTAIHSQSKKPVMLKHFFAFPKSHWDQIHNIYNGIKQISSDHVAATYDLAQIKAHHHETPVMIYEHIPGIRLREYLDTGKRSFEGILNMGIQLAEALADLHLAGFTHTGITPHSITIHSSDQTLKITDFDFFTSPNMKDENTHQPDIPSFFLSYISPEQTGRTDHGIDYRTDFYSLGIILYECLTGRLPFTNKDPLKLVHSHLAVDPEPPSVINSEIPMVVSDIVLKLLAKDPNERYQSAWGIKADLERCLDEWMSTGSVDRFVVADKDIPHILKIPRKLYGREKEVSALVSNIEKTGIKNTQMILVSGQPGIGKSALVAGMQKPVMSKRGYFISGKFDQIKRGVPYTPIIQAFDKLIGQILTESTDQVSRWKKKLLKNLGPNGQVMIEMIPDLQLIIGKQPEVPVLGAVESRNRFNYVFSNFIRTFACEKHPLAIFLDDLQWADRSSLKLIELLMSMDVDHLIILGAFRDNEVMPAHPLSLMTEKLRKNRSAVEIIRLGPLEETHVSQLICETLVYRHEDTKDLVRLCMEKTRGNPFFLHQFINSLYRKKLLGFDPEKGRWKWDAEKISMAETAGNVTDLIVEKLHKLSREPLRIMQLAACIGNRIDLNTLALINKQSSSDTLKNLKEPLKEKLILQDSNLQQEADICFRFLHDRVQQAAYSFIPEADRPSVHLGIGRRMLENIPESHRESRIFDIVDQLNLGSESISDPNERQILARLNLTAAQKAKLSAAFEPAFDYLTTGLGLLDPGSWKKQYQLCLELHVEAAEAAYLNSRFDQTDQLAETVIEKAETLLDAKKAYEIRIRSYAMQNKLSESVDIGLHILKKLGIRFPKKTNTFHILTGVIKTKLALWGKNPDDLMNLPEMTDPKRIAIMQISRPLGSSAYLTDPKLMLLMVIKTFNLAIKHGHVPEASCYDSYGLLLCLIGEIDAGYQYGQISIELIDRFEIKKNESQVLVTFNAFIRHWKEPIHSVLHPLLRAYQIGLETGELEWAGYASLMYCINAYFCGKPLLELESEMKKYGRFMAGIKQDTSMQYNDIFHQTIANLMGRSKNPTRLVGEYYNADKMLPVHLEAKDESALFDMHFHKMVLSYLFYEHEEGLDNAIIAEKHLEVVLAQPENPLFHFYDSLIRLALYTETSQTEKRRYLRKVAKNQKKMKKWAHHAPTNCLHKYHLVEAVRNRVLEKIEPAMDHFDTAISLAGENKFIQEKALANELAAHFYFSRSKPKIAQIYLKEAHKSYLEWGAFAKVNHIESLYPDLFITNTAEWRTEQNSFGGFGHRVDLASVTKAVKAITGEKNPGSLLNRLMPIVIENAGARKGYLILKREGRYIIEAGISSNKEDLKGTRIPIDDCSDLCAGVVHYVIRTANDVLLDDAAHSGKFTSDPYILRNNIKSILCMPITDHDQMTGVIYLENRQVKGAFTTERVEILRTVSEILANAWARLEAEENLMAHQEQLRSLSSQIVLTEERERRKIAVDLHDRIGHALSDIMLRLGSFRQTLRSSESLSCIDEISRIVEQCSEDTHSLTFDISPPILYDLGLEAALDWLADQTRFKHNIHLDFRDDEKPKPLAESDRILLFQAARELVFNMAKHSKASSGTLSISRKGPEIHLIIEDDGIGFSPEEWGYQQKKHGGFGLFSIKERLEQQKGRLLVESKVGSGTRMIMILPLADNKPD